MNSFLNPKLASILYKEIFGNSKGEDMLNSEEFTKHHIETYCLISNSLHGDFNWSSLWLLLK